MSVNPFYETQQHLVVWFLHPAPIASPCHQMNESRVLVSGDDNKACRSKCWGWGRQKDSGASPYSVAEWVNKDEVAGYTKVLMPEGLTRRRRSVTSCGFWLLLGVMRVSAVMDDF